MKPVSGVTIAAPITSALPVPDETAMLVNISESSFATERTYGTYSIRGCKASEPYVTHAIHARRGVIDMGDRPPGGRDPFKNTNQFIIHAEEIGVDLVRGWNTDIWGIGSTPFGEVAQEVVRGFAGVFVADGLEPTAEELEQATNLLSLCDKALAEQAHMEWDQFHEPKTIHMGWKRAARRLGVDAPWLYTIVDARSLPDCPHCGAKLLTKTATVCSVCTRDVVPPEGVVTASPSRKRGVTRHRAANHNAAA
jgi:hypothetical protein